MLSMVIHNKVLYIELFCFFLGMSEYVEGLHCIAVWGNCDYYGIQHLLFFHATISFSFQFK